LLQPFGLSQFPDNTEVSLILHNNPLALLFLQWDFGKPKKQDDKEDTGPEKRNNGHQ